MHEDDREFNEYRRFRARRPSIKLEMSDGPNKITLKLEGPEAGSEHTRYELMSKLIDAMQK